MLRELLDTAVARLRAAGVERPISESQRLAAQALRIDRTILLAHPEHEVGAADVVAFQQLLERRAAREPLAYLTGQREFFGRTFKTDRRALIPRPETELLVEEALAVLRHGPSRPLVVDVGTGSGCIAITLALELPAAKIVASDLSAEALALARANRQQYALGRRIRLVQGNLLGWLQRGADLIVANLPYVPAEALASLEPEIRDYEPRQALDGGPGGARLICALIEQAARLRVGGLLAELDCRHADQVLATARAAWPRRAVDIVNDLAGLPRLLRVGADR